MYSLLSELYSNCFKLEFTVSLWDSKALIIASCGEIEGVIEFIFNSKALINLLLLSLTMPSFMETFKIAFLISMPLCVCTR